MLILASSSPRRKEILQMAGLDYICIPSDAEEIIPDGFPVDRISEYLSGLKAESVFRSHPEDTVIGADTVVIIDGTVLGKPKSKEDAFSMLKKLSGRVHTVTTGVTIFSGHQRESFTSSTEVEFYKLTDQEIRSYIETGEPMDKAGAYGIQGYGSVLVKKITGDYFTVMGLPIGETVRSLAKVHASDQTAPEISSVFSR